MGSIYLNACYKFKSSKLNYHLTLGTFKVYCLISLPYTIVLKIDRTLIKQDNKNIATLPSIFMPFIMYLIKYVLLAIFIIYYDSFCGLSIKKKFSFKVNLLIHPFYKKV